MNGEICIWCNKPMGNSLHTVRHGRDRKKYPIHKKCYWDNSIHKIFEKIETQFHGSGNIGGKNGK